MAGSLKLLFALLLVFVNAFFVLSEFSLVKIRRTRLEELIQQGNKRAELALKITGRFDTYLGATQLGITLSSLGLGWLGEPAVASLLAPITQKLPLASIIVSTLTYVVSFLVITFLHIVLGELVPKSLAIHSVERAALFTSYPLYIFHKLGYPIILLFNKGAQLTLKLWGIKPARDTEIAHSEEELRMIVSASQRGGVLDQLEGELIENVFDFADRVAREIMVPRQDMICLFVDDPLTRNLEIVDQTRHTRYPLCQGDKDHVVGVVHIRDVMHLEPAEQSLALQTVAHEALVVPEGMHVARLLQEFRTEHKHLAIVADEYGGTAGLLTVEDILEELVGEIYDEYDPEEYNIVRRDDNSYEFDGGVLVEDVAELLHIDMGETEEDTIGGYVFGMLGRKPEVDDVIIIGDYRVTVLETNGFRVTRVDVTPNPDQTG